MKIDGTLNIEADPTTAAETAASHEAAGYNGFWVAELSHDPFLPLAQACLTTESIELGTSIAVAFARNPMTLANTAYDLQLYSKGRFTLGLGSQIKPHITKRFSMEWSKPAARMRDMVLAIRAIWASWADGTKLEHRGEFYTHTLMTPMFDPGPNPYGNPNIFLAGVGPLMTQVAGEVADGFMCHGFTTERYLREVTIPALDKGRAKVGKDSVLESDSEFQITGPSFVVTGSNDEEIEAAALATRQQIAFYGSTPAYRPVLELHGWGELQNQLHLMSKQGEWLKMGDLITDEILDAFAVVGSPEEVGPEIHSRYSDVVKRLSFYAPYQSDPERWSKVMTGLKTGSVS